MTWSDTASTPSNLGIFKQVMAFSLLQGAAPTVSDCIAAYVQARLPEGSNIYVHCEDSLLTPSMTREVEKLRSQGVTGPLVWKLARPIYGLPQSGAVWQRHLTAVLQKLRWRVSSIAPQTFEKISEIDGAIVILSAYVDDLLMGGSAVNMAHEWKLIRAELKTTEPEVASRVLGCFFRYSRVGDKVWEMTMSMKSFFQECVNKYNRIPDAPQLSKRCTTPARTFVNSDYTDPVLQSPGVLRHHAASLLMSVMYGARCCRPDLLAAVCSCACFLKDWTRMADARLVQLFSYVGQTLNLVLAGTVCESDAKQAHLAAYADADLAGSDDSCRSTSGGVTLLRGPKTSLVLEFWSSRQHCVSHSTAESEIVSLSKCVRDFSAPAQAMWSSWLQRPIQAIHHEDNSAAITIIAVGYSLAMRTLAKHKRVNLAELHEHFRDSSRQLVHCPTKEQLADILTKGLSGQMMSAATQMLGMIIKSDREILG